MTCLLLLHHLAEPPLLWAVRARHHLAQPPLLRALGAAEDATADTVAPTAVAE